MVDDAFEAYNICKVKLYFLLIYTENHVIYMTFKLNNYIM